MNQAKASAPPNRATPGQSLRSHVPALMVIAAVVAAAYLVPVLQGRVFYSDDTTDINYVMFRSHVTDLKNHGFTAWTPGLATGHYRAADPTYGIWSPLRLMIFLLVPGYNAQLMTTVVYAFLAGLGAYLFGLVITGRKFPALYLGLGFPLCGAFASMTLNMPYFTSAAWLPFLFAAGLGIKSPARRAALIALFAALTAVDGDPIGSGLGLALLLAVVLAWPGRKQKLHDLTVLFSAAVLYLLLTAVIWWPALELAPESRRAGGLAIEESLAFSLHPLRVINLVAPRFFGQVEEGSLWAPELTNSIRGLGFWHRTVYLGLLSPILWLFALFFSQSRRRAGVFLVLALALAILSFGKYAPFLPWLLKEVELFRFFRYPAKLFMFASLLFLAASALGLNELERQLISKKQRLGAALIVFFLLLTILIGLTSFSAQSSDAIRHKSRRPELAQQRIRQDRLRLGLIAVAFPAALLIMGRPGGRRRLGFAPLVIVISAADLLFSLPAFSTNPRQGLEDDSELIARMQNLYEKDHSRVFVDNSMFKVVNLGPRPSLRPNWGTLDGVDYAVGASASIFRPVFDLEDMNQFMDTDAAMLRILGANYIITSLAPSPDWIRVLTLKGVIRPDRDFPMDNISVYVSAQLHSRAFITRSIQNAATRNQALETSLKTRAAAEGSRPVYISQDAALVHGRLVRPAPRLPELPPGTFPDDQIISYHDDEGDRVIVIADLDREGWLVCRDYAMTGWRAYVDDEETTIYFADGIGRAILVPAGRHEVVFAFKPRGVRYGAIGSGLAVLFCLCALGLSYFRNSHDGLTKKQALQ